MFVFDLPDGQRVRLKASASWAEQTLLPAPDGTWMMFCSDEDARAVVQVMTLIASEFSWVPDPTRDIAARSRTTEAA